MYQPTGLTIEAQLKDATPEFLLRCNPYAKLEGISDLGDEPSYREYLDRLDQPDRFSVNGRLPLRFAVHQLIEMAELLGHMSEWPEKNHTLKGAWYAARRLDGDSHRFAEMMVNRRPPGCMTDREFLEGHCNGNQFEGQEVVGDAYKAIAKAEGVDITGAVYISGLAQYPGDPKAWVRGRGDVQKVCEERGYTAQGAVNVKSGSRIDTDDDVAVADDIVEQRVMEKLDRDPSTALRDVGEVYHEARQEIKPHWAA